MLVPAYPGEKCPFCGTEINEGASVCSGCRAKKRCPGFWYEQGGAGFLFLLIISLAPTALAIAEESFPWFCITGLFTLGFAARFIYLFKRRKDVFWQSE